MTVILAEFIRPERATNSTLSNSNVKTHLLVLFFIRLIFNKNIKIVNIEISILNAVKNFPSKVKKVVFMPYNIKLSIHPG